MARTVKPSGLTDRQYRFVQEYLVDLNATQAAMRAGYKPHTASRTGCENLKKPEIASAIAAAQAARSQRVALTQDAILTELALLALSDIRHYVIDDTGNVHLAPGAPAAAMRAVASLKKRIVPTAAGPIYETEIRLWNKPASVKMAGQHLGLFTERADRAQVSDLLKAVLLELAEREEPRNVTPAAAWAPVPPAMRPAANGHQALPPPPAVEDA
jgi:phage terminase small subunit